jgi:hypothetical protein
MYSSLKYILGPELYWILLTVAVHFRSERNLPATEAGSRALESLWPWLPFAALPLTFAAFLVPGVGRGWLLLRVGLAAGIGVSAALYILAGHVDYRDSRNSGVPYIWFFGTVMGWVVLLLCAAVTGGVLWWQSRR